MGRWGRRGRKPEPREKPRTNRSGSYSDDYRITPELQAADAHTHAHKMVSDAHVVCGDACCSQDERCCTDDGSCCSQDERCCSKLEPLPRRYNRVRSPSAEGSRRGSFRGMEVIVVDEGRVDLRREAPCTSCESCDTCRWPADPVTKIELKNHLFTSPMHADTTPHEYKEREMSPHRSHNSPHRRYIKSEGVGQRPVAALEVSGRQGVGEDGRLRAPATKGNTGRNPSNPSGVRRAASGRRTTSTASNSDQSRQSRRDAHRTQQHTHAGMPALEVVGTRPPSLYVTLPEPQEPADHAHDHAWPGRRYGASPERKDSPAAGSPSGGRVGSGGSAGKKDPSSKLSMTLSKRDLLNQMVNQTKQHRQQIRSLENELERLRSGDVLSKCEVSMSDVEWRPGNVVGEGSFSTVYRGTYCGTEVAVKELKFKLSQDDKNYFRSEAALLQQLHHPRVVLLMGVCTVAARPFMLLEYLSGGTLYNLIHATTRERLDHAAYFVVAKDVAQGMNYLHRHEPQVLHLDLKSMNVLLDSYCRAKIADFGFSILRRSRTGSPAQRGSIRGTPAWMAPELLTKGDVSSKCDVYSYAIILWEMLTASHPFKGLDIYQIMETIEAGNRPPLPSSGVSQELKELITSCWAQNPSLRPSFEEILGALESAAVPASWRGVLHKANIAPSLLSDVAAARTIIGVVEQSVELVRRSLQLQRAKNRNQEFVEMKREHQLQQYDAMETVGVTVATPARQQHSRDPAARFLSGRLPRSPREQTTPTQRITSPRRPSTSKQTQEVTHTQEHMAGSREHHRQRESMPRDDSRRRSPDKRSRPSRSNSNRLAATRDTRDGSMDQRRVRKGHSKEKGERHLDNRPESKDHRRGNRRSSGNSRDRDYRGRDIRLKKDRSKESELRVSQKQRRDTDADRARDQWNWDDERGYSRGRQPPRQVFERRNANKKDRYVRDRRSTSLESHKDNVHRRSSSRDHQSSSNERRFSSTDRHSELRREIRRGKFYNREKGSSREQRRHGDRRSDNHERLTDSRDSLGESPDESWTSLERSSSTGSNNILDDPDDPRLLKRDHRRYSSSPRRRSRERRYSPSVIHPEHHHYLPDQHNPDYRCSPERWRSSRSPQRRSRMRTPDSRRTESGSRLGPLVTSEQLMSQKQRLRPVRPAALSDLSHIPENSLNDISIILKTAITKRRDAFDEGLSGRDSFRSEDVDWSDWH
ncbi:uncharacterized protein [Panulirus ornatus]|uniref:uncharacterized protein n=1 Tax=Panulirus ornatus TaxID=150431 RepID=UPI003A877923